MIRQSECPGVERLRDLLDGMLTDAEQRDLTLHLDGCAPCQQGLETLAAGGQPWTGLSRLGRWRLRSEPALGRAMAQLKHSLPTEGVAPPSAICHLQSATAEGEPILDFLSPPEQPGQLGRFGPYEVLEVLGHGGMGIVLKGRDPVLNRIIAIKVLAPQLAASGAARQRFAREARAAAAISHEHVVAIHAVDTARGLPYLVMEYVPGPSLQQRLDRDGPLELEEVLRIAMQVASGLAAAHAQGVVHRDVKPGNILLEDGVERVKITDFGLARAADDATVTQSGYLPGTPAYMAPEQASGEGVDHRSDLFSLGSVVYAMCAGRPPFRASTLHGLLLRVSGSRPTPLREINPRVPEWLVEIMNKLHAKDPAQRFQSATEAAKVFAECLAHVQQPTSAPLPWFLRKYERRRPSPRRGWLVAAAVLLLLGVGMAATVLRIRTAEGTLVIEVSDPKVKVRVDGQEVVISGAGLAEIRLKSGPHKVQASKDGKPVLTRLIEVKRNGKEVVRVSLETNRPALKPGGGGAPARVSGILELKGHTGKVSALRFSPEGRRLASVGQDGSIRLWDVPTGRIRALLRAHRTSIVATAFSADGRVLLSVGEDGSVRLWDAVTGKLQMQLNLRASFKASALDAGSRWLATAGAGALQVWDVKTGKLLSATVGQKAIKVLAFSPDGKLLASSSLDKTVRVWNTETAKMVKAMKGHEAMPRSLAFTPDGRVLVSGGDAVWLWDTTSGKELRRLGGKTVSFTRVATSPDGRRVAAGGSDGSVRIFELGTGKLLVALPGGSGAITALTFSPDGRRLAWATVEGVVRVWKIAVETTELQRLRDEAALWRQQVKEQQIRAEKERLRAERLLYSLQLQQAQRQWNKIGGGGAGQLQRLNRTQQAWEAAWSGVPKIPLVTFAGHPAPVLSVAFSPDARHFASAGADGTVRVRDATTGKETRLLRGHKGAVNAVAYSPDNRVLASVGEDGQVILRDPATGKVRVRVHLAGDPLQAAAFSPDGRLVAVTGTKRMVRLFNVSDGREEARPAGSKGTGLGVAFSPDGKLLAVADGEDAAVYLWEAGTGRLLRTLTRRKHIPRVVTFSPDGKHLASGYADGTLCIWDPPTGKQVAIIEGHKAAVTGLVYSPNGRRLVSASLDKTIHLWDGATGKLVLTRADARGGVTCVAYGAAGRYFVTGSSDKKVRLYAAYPAAPAKRP